MAFGMFQGRQVLFLILDDFVDLILGADVDASGRLIEDEERIVQVF